MKQEYLTERCPCFDSRRFASQLLEVIAGFKSADSDTNQPKTQNSDHTVVDRY
jgi:hypothetical protein